MSVILENTKIIKMVESNASGMFIFYNKVLVENSVDDNV